MRTKKSANEMKKLIEAARIDEDILAVILFGSLARGEIARDVDVCLVLDPEKLRSVNTAKKSLEYILGFDLDVHLYHELPLYVRMRVLKEGKIKLVKDEDKLYDIAEATVREFEYFKPRYEDYLEGVMHG